MDYSPKCNIFDRLISASISDDENDNLLNYNEKPTCANVDLDIEPKLEPLSAPNSPEENIFDGNYKIKTEPQAFNGQSDPVSMFDSPRRRRTRNPKSNSSSAKNARSEQPTSIIRRSSRIKPRIESARVDDKFSLQKLTHNDAVVATKTVTSADDLSLTTKQNQNAVRQGWIKNNRKRVRASRAIIKKSKRKKTSVEKTNTDQNLGSSSNIVDENVVENPEEPIKNGNKPTVKNITPPTAPIVVKKPTIVFKKCKDLTRRNVLPEVRNLSDVLNLWSAKMELQSACGFGLHENLPVDKVISKAILRIKNLQNQKTMAAETTVNLLNVQKELFTKLLFSSSL